jgi:hypothetical protein
MQPKDDDLASRMRAAIDEQDANRSAARQAEAVESVDVAAARSDMFARMREFADSVGHIEAQSDDDTLLLSYGDRGVRFSADGNGVIVSLIGWPGAEISRAWPESAMAGRWVLAFRRHGREEQMPLFERGLEELLVHGLGLPRPEAVDRPISPRTAAALVGSGSADDTDRRDRPEAPVRAQKTPSKPTSPGEAPAPKRKRTL